MSDREPKALVFDVDGTLYHQRKLRWRVALRFVRAVAQSPAEGLQAVRAVRAYRRAQEVLRAETSPGSTDVAQAQLSLAARRSGLSEERVRHWVIRWMEREPLSLLPACAMEDLHRTLQLARSRGLRLGVFSDYPALEKLRALGVLDMFDAVVSAQDPDVQRFKPDPRGIEVAIRRLGVAREDAVYIGDRPDVDAVAAARAGVRCVIVGASAGSSRHGSYSRKVSYAELASAVVGTQSWA